MKICIEIELHRDREVSNNDAIPGDEVAEHIQAEIESIDVCGWELSVNEVREGTLPAPKRGK